MRLRFAHVVLATVCCGLSAAAAGAETVKFAFIGSLSGGFALQGQETLHTAEAATEIANAASTGRRLEMVPLDNKGSPQESLILLKQAIDQDIRIIVAGVSNVAHAVVDAVAKHNARNPDRPVLFLDYGALDPALTEAKCNYWHFRFDAHADTQVNVMVDYMAKKPTIRKVYLINQDYAFGQATAKASREALAARRPDIEIVGDDLIPLGKIKDFAPYAAKIRASGADSVLTGNWGNDLSLLIRAGKESGLTANYYTLLAAYFGTAREIGAEGIDRVKTLYAWNINVADATWDARLSEYKSRFKSVSNLDYLPMLRTIRMLSMAIDKANSADPARIVPALEGLRYAGPSGDSWMRAEDHQIIAPIYVLSYAKVGQPGVKHDAEGNGVGWKLDTLVEAKDATPPLKCQMERPPK